MDKLFRKNIFLLIEASVFMIVLLVPIFTLIIFFINHSTLVFSTKTWLLLAISYNLLIVTILPIGYSLASELIIKVKNPST